MDNLTQRQSEILDWIKACVARNGYGPSVREIGKHFGITSPNGVQSNLRALARKGAIKRHFVNGRAVLRAFQFPGGE